MGDLWRWGDSVIAPREVEAAISGAVGRSLDWRAVGSAHRVTVAIDADAAEQAIGAVRALLDKRGIAVPVVADELGPMTGFKRRRVTFLDG